MGPCRFVGGSVSRLGIPYAWALPLLTTCRHLPRPAHQSGSFLQSSAHMAQLLCRPHSQPPRRTGSGRKKTHASSIRRTFAQQLPRRCASWLLASQVRRRRWKRGSSQLDPSEPNSQKANERKARKAKESNARPQSVPTGGGRINFSITRSCNRLWSKSSIRSGFGPSKNAPR